MALSPLLDLSGYSDGRAEVFLECWVWYDIEPVGADIYDFMMIGAVYNEDVHDLSRSGSHLFFGPGFREHGSDDRAGEPFEPGADRQVSRDARRCDDGARDEALEPAVDAPDGGGQAAGECRGREREGCGYQQDPRVPAKSGATGCSVAPQTDGGRERDEYRSRRLEWVGREGEHDEGGEHYAENGHDGATPQWHIACTS